MSEHASSEQPYSRGERVTDLTDWTHATVRFSGQYTTPLSGEPCVSLLYDDGRKRDYVPVFRLARS